MFEPECLDQVHGTILHPVGHLEDMLVSLKIWSLGTLKDKADEYWERKKLNKVPKKRSCSTVFCPDAAVGRIAFTCCSSSNQMLEERQLHQNSREWKGQETEICT